MTSDSVLTTQTMNHLQRGEWESAILGLEKLLLQQPDQPILRRALEDARIKAKLDGEIRLRPRRWILPYQVWVDRAVLVLAVFVAVWLAGALMYRQSALRTAQVEQERIHAIWLVEANQALASDDLATAEERLERILGQSPNDAKALSALGRVEKARKLLYRYQEAVSLQSSGDCAGALKGFEELLVEVSTYRDLNARTLQCRQQIQIAQVLDKAAQLEQSNDLDDAIQSYEEGRALGVVRLQDGSPLTARLAKLYMQAGSRALTAANPDRQQLLQANSDFQQALQLEPDNNEAAHAADLLNRYLTGAQALEQEDWATAVSNLRPVYEQQADYLAGGMVEKLYQAYLGLGDGYRASGDCGLALQRYSAAAALPVRDNTLARSRSNLADCGTATATPLPETALFITSTVENTEQAVPTGEPTNPPSTTAPPAALASYHNQIVFKSSNQASPGFWAMDGSGNNRQFIGGLEDAQLLAQFNALLAAYRVSPDGEFQVFVDAELNKVPQVYIGRLDNAWPPHPLTKLTGIAYDPQWSPVNGAIVFVTQEDGSDDIWFIGADGESQHSLLRNTWEWDKSPTWSPDGSQIAFWSNRSGLKQVYVMSADGKLVKNVSNSAWDEYDPLWVR
ncbi:MAG: hypothetical protein U0175_12980 [Caldilineaceae bacterium]